MNYDYHNSLEAESFDMYELYARNKYDKNDNQLPGVNIVKTANARHLSDKWNLIFRTILEYNVIRQISRRLWRVHEY